MNNTKNLGETADKFGMGLLIYSMAGGDFLGVVGASVDF